MNQIESWIKHRCCAWVQKRVCHHRGSNSRNGLKLLLWSKLKICPSRESWVNRKIDPIEIKICLFTKQCILLCRKDIHGDDVVDELEDDVRLVQEIEVDQVFTENCFLARKIEVGNRVLGPISQNVFCHKADALKLWLNFDAWFVVLIEFAPRPKTKKIFQRKLYSVLFFKHSVWLLKLFNQSECLKIA